MPKAILGVWPNLTVEVQSDKSFEIVKELAFWDSVPHECPVRIDAGEICGAALHFTFRAPVARQGPNKGKSFPYAGLECTGNPAHEVQFSQREDQSGIFIRTGNRNDGKPNWRLAYKVHSDDEEAEYQQQSYQGNSESNGRETQPPLDEKEKWVNELIRLGKEKGYVDEKALGANCRHIYNKDLRQLTRDEAKEYYRTLHAL